MTSHSYMAPDEVRDALKTLGLTQTAAADMLGISDRVVRRWVAGAVPTPRWAALLLKVLLRHGISATTADGYVTGGML